MSLIRRLPRWQNPTGQGLWYSAYGIPLSRWRMPDNFTNRNPALSCLSVSMQNTSTSRFTGKVPKVLRLMSALYTIPAGEVYGSGCVSRTLDRRCVSAVPIWTSGAEVAGDPRIGSYRPFPDTTNPARKAELETIEFPLPSNFRLGLAYDIIDSGSNLLTLALDANHPNDNSERLNIGMEYWYRKMAAIRGGYKFRLGEDRADDEEGLTLGLGIHLNLGRRVLSLDYAYADFGRLQQVHRVSLGLQF